MGNVKAGCAEVHLPLTVPILDYHVVYRSRAAHHLKTLLPDRALAFHKILPFQSSLPPPEAGTETRSFKAVACPLHRFLPWNRLQITRLVGLIPTLCLFNPELFCTRIQIFVQIINQGARQRRLLPGTQGPNFLFKFFEICSHSKIILLWSFDR